jgi:hypothetical protein
MEVSIKSDVKNSGKRTENFECESKKLFNWSCEIMKKRKKYFIKSEAKFEHFWSFL